MAWHRVASLHAQTNPPASPNGRSPHIPLANPRHPLLLPLLPLLIDPDGGSTPLLRSKKCTEEEDTDNSRNSLNNPWPLRTRINRLHPSSSHRVYRMDPRPTLSIVHRSSLNKPTLSSRTLDNNPNSGKANHPSTKWPTSFRT